MGKYYNAEYQREYYRKNREKIRKERQKRYRKDPDYKKAIRSRARVQAASKSMERKRRRESFKIEIAGTLEKPYYMKDMAPVLNRGIVSMRNWRTANIIPEPLARDGRGRGMYSESQVRMMAHVMHLIDTGSLRITYRNMAHVFHDLWEEKFSKTKTNNAVKEVLHGKYFEQDKKEDDKYKKETGRKRKKSIDVPTELRV